jgi:ParB family chromosome partitioning protein
MRDEVLARAAARTGEVGEDAGRHAGLDEQLRGASDGQRRLLRRLDDHRAAGGEGRGHLPAVEVHGVVPRHDRGDDADRRVAHEVADVAPHARAHAAAHAAPFLGVVAQDLGAERDLLRAVGHRLALLARQEVGELVDVGVDQLGAPAQDRAPLVGVGGRPAGGSALRGGDGRVDVSRPRDRAAPHQLARGGVADVARRAVRSGGPRTVDEQLALDHRERRSRHSSS